MDFLNSILELIVAIYNVIISFFAMLVPYIPLIAWIAYWLIGVNWVKFRKTLVEGGVVPLALLGMITILIWGLIAPPEGGVHDLGLVQVSNYVGKTVFVTALFVIMFLCGAVQLSGACGNCVCFADDEDEPAEAPAH